MFSVLLGVLTLILLTLVSTAQTKQNGKIKKTLTNTKQPLVVNDSTRRADSLKLRADSLDRATFSKDSLAAPVTYSAQDSGILDIPNKKFTLYGKATTKYQTMDLSSGVIEIDNQNHLAKAYGFTDSLGQKTDVPIMNDGSAKTTSDSLFYNMTTQKGLTKTTFTQQGEMYIYAERFKKVSQNIYFGYNNRVTTCNLDTPHFAFRLRKMKVINNKWAYSGIVYPEIEGVPIPIGLPFGIFPLSTGRHSGLLAPSFVNDYTRGIGFENIGYYKVISEYLDITTRASIYSYGGYSLNLTPTYRKRYAYNGGINFSYIHSVYNSKGDPDYSTTNAMNIVWNHSVDSKAHPGQTFSANVNAGSSRYNGLVTNNVITNFTNQQSSSIQFSKSWDNGKYNLQTSATGNQNNTIHYHSVSFPNVNFNVATFYPFENKERVGAAKWYEKLGIGYSGTLTNQFAWYDTATYKKGLAKYLLDTLQWSANHSIPISLSLPSLGPVQVSPGISYSENWFGQKILHAWNPSTQRLDTILTRGVFAARQMTTSLSFQTAVFGMYHLKGDALQIRHTIRPQMSMNYSPDLQSQFYYTQQVDTARNKVLFSSITGNTATGRQGKTGGISFGITQQIEGKKLDKTDTTGKKFTKFTIIDNLSISSSYNFLADSMKLQPFSIQLGTTLFKKVSISASSTLQPYVLNKFALPTSTYAWNGGHGFSLGSITNASFSMSTSIQSKKKDDKKTTTTNNTQNDFYNPEENQAQLNYIRSHPAEYTDFNIPWTLGTSFAFSYTKVPKTDFSGFTANTTASVSLNGDFSLTPKWKVGANGYYDFVTNKVQTVTMFISREMHCWQLSINVTPVGPYQSFSFTFNPKSGILRDLKINRTKSFVTPL